jgi:hypothetical protein
MSGNTTKQFLILFHEIKDGLFASSYSPGFPKYFVIGIVCFCYMKIFCKRTGKNPSKDI